jgi:hypothetical protein
MRQELASLARIILIIIVEGGLNVDTALQANIGAGNRLGMCRKRQNEAGGGRKGQAQFHDVSPDD